MFKNGISPLILLLPGLFKNHKYKYKQQLLAFSIDAQGFVTNVIFITPFLSDTLLKRKSGIYTAWY